MFRHYSNPLQPVYEVRSPKKAYAARPSAKKSWTYDEGYSSPGRDYAEDRRGHEKRGFVDAPEKRRPSYTRQTTYTYTIPVKEKREARPKPTRYETEPVRRSEKSARYADVRPAARAIPKKPREGEDYFYAVPRESPAPRYADRDDYNQYKPYQVWEAVSPSYKPSTPRTPQPTQRASRPPLKRSSRYEAPPKRKATVADIERWDLPRYCESYSFKNWDPSEEPYTLLGSIFDANALGKWIYDWTVHHKGSESPMAGVAGEFWVMLIELAGKRLRGDEVLPRVRSRRRREILERMLDHGDDLRARVRTLLKVCEKSMWQRAERELPDEPRRVKVNSGCAFVDTCFGRDRELLTMEVLMHDIRCWIRDFEEDCEPVIKRPRE